ncbi:polyprenyl synthetase family protein [Paracrocinitomix mangrovi]|uniref:polyprenyl synthetase family protein n=1 Tax=Paracrocinitomix mangrovi TaxID=2862509 RepID=UPI001C8CF8B4|nr:polyprenyl synthetase family protein [Paracrocinitomix mangrovi]UKN00902.1 polyprenyl synthetase family protein [Paracrocinitomix mangrovi]
MVTVREIKANVASEMEIFEQKFKASMKSEVALLDKITHYIIKRKGKQMRPMFVFLTAKTINGKVEESTYTAASLIELLHTATLVHDDVVDDANERRGFFSVNALWKNKIAVLVGDYLLARGLLMSVDNKEFQILKIVSTAVREMSEGELLQIEKARRLDITEEVYFDIIRQKTASLIASCCAAGAASVSDDPAMVSKWKKFGELVGIAFQIKDDIFDYGDAEKIGKPTGNDIRERKMTLPLIYTLNNASPTDRKKLINIVKKHNEKRKYVKEAIQMVIASGGVKYAHERMMEIKKQALDVIADVEDNDAKRALVGLVEYTVNRDK